MAFLLLKFFVLAFSGADFNFWDKDNVSLNRLLTLAVDHLVRRLETLF